MKLSAIAAFLETDIQTEIPALKKVLRASGASSLEHVLQVVQQLNGEYPAAVLVFGPADQKIENDMMLENQGTLLVVGTFSVAVAESEEGLWDILDAFRGYFKKDDGICRAIGTNVLAQLSGWRPVELPEFPGVGAFAVGFTIEDRD